jgi:hypothetical protein
LTVIGKGLSKVGGIVGRNGYYVWALMRSVENRALRLDSHIELTL